MQTYNEDYLYPLLSPVKLNASGSTYFPSTTENSRKTHYVCPLFSFQLAVARKITFTSKVK